MEAGQRVHATETQLPSVTQIHEVRAEGRGKGIRIPAGDFIFQNKEKPSRIQDSWASLSASQV